MSVERLIIRDWNELDTNACIAAFESNLPEFFDMSEQALFVDFLHKIGEWSTRDVHYFAVELDGSVIGCGGICLTRELDKCCMAWGMIHRDFHKKGYGKKLLEYRVEAWKKLFGDYPLVLDTTQHSAPFFERMGFVITNVIADYYAKGMDRYDMVYTEL